MLINTHILIGRKIYENIDCDKRALLKETQFIWGNVKPDCAFKYKLMKHYKDESFIMIINKIEFLSNLSIKDLYTTYTINKFNQELGVICHFLCDYFCLPHHQRWEFKSANIVKEHLMYEKNLDKVAKEYNFTDEKNIEIKPDNVVEFINEMLLEYEMLLGCENYSSYERDLRYAFYVCNTIMNMIINNIIENEYKIRIASNL